MAGKFINTRHNSAVQSLVQGYKDRLKNPYYMHSDKSPFIVEYFKINEQATTLDEGLRVESSRIGPSSPLRFNLIHDFTIYCDEQLNVQLNDEEGLRSEDIEGVCYILPNTINPMPGDYFIVSHINNKWLFCIKSVNVDTLESGANFHEANFYLNTSVRADDIYNQVVEEYNYVINNSGTEFNPVVRKSDYDFINSIEEYTLMLKRFYKELFYSGRVDTFILKQEYRFNMYDPYLIEFMINNKILDGDDEYLYLCHQLTRDATFSIKYRNTIFHAIEKRSIENLNTCNHVIVGSIIDHKKYPLSTMTQRMEPYFKVDYIKGMQPLSLQESEQPWISQTPQYVPLSNTLLSDIQEHKYSDNICDIIVAYFNEATLTEKMLEHINSSNYEHNVSFFYNIPIIIFVLEQYCRKLISNSKNI